MEVTRDIVGGGLTQRNILDLLLAEIRKAILWLQVRQIIIKKKLRHISKARLLVARCSLGSFVSNPRNGKQVS